MQTIALNIESQNLFGKIRPDEKTIIFINATNGNINISLPDLTVSDKLDITFIRTDESSNTVYITPENNKKINNKTTLQIFIDEGYVLHTDKSNYYVVKSNNLL